MTDLVVGRLRDEPNKFTGTCTIEELMEAVLRAVQIDTIFAVIIGADGLPTFREVGSLKLEFVPVSPPAARPISEQSDEEITQLLSPAPPSEQVPLPTPEPISETPALRPISGGKQGVAAPEPMPPAGTLVIDSVTPATPEAEAEASLFGKLFTGRSAKKRA